jgi:octaprenyl-diphosphate synthase
LLLLTAQAAGEVNSSHHVLGAVVELIHTATLVHDDVLDEALLRRHQPTIKAGWGNQSSILLGDMLFSRAFHLASTVGDAVACEVIGRSTNRVCEGELHQVTERGNLDLTEADYLDIIDGKTAELTACCCHLGALYAGAGNDVVHHLSRFGRNLGLAFQIADDLLDITGHEAATGKTLGTDLQQKKMTLPMIYMLSRLATDARKQVQRQLETGSLTRAELLPHLQDTGATAYSMRRADEFAMAARRSLKCLPNSETKQMLESLTDWSIRREK